MLVSVQGDMANDNDERLKAEGLKIRTKNESDV